MRTAPVIIRHTVVAAALSLCSSHSAAGAPPLPPPPPGKSMVPPLPPLAAIDAAAPAAERPLAPRERATARPSLRTGLVLGAVVSQVIAVSLDIASAAADDCARPGDLAGVGCRAGRPERLGLGLGALASHVTSFGLAAGAGHVQGGLRAERRPPTTRHTRAVAWLGGLLVAAGVMGTAASGLATQSACDGGACDRQRALAASLLRGASTLAASFGVGLLTWREGTRARGGLALAPGQLGVTLDLRF